MFITIATGYISQGALIFKFFSFFTESINKVTNSNSKLFLVAYKKVSFKELRQMLKILVGSISFIMFFSSIANAVTVSNPLVINNDTTKIKFFKQRIKSYESKLSKVAVDYRKRQYFIAKKIKHYSAKIRVTRNKVIKRRYSHIINKYRLKARQNLRSYLKSKKSYSKKIVTLRSKIAHLESINGRSANNYKIAKLRKQLKQIEKRYTKTKVAFKKKQKIYTKKANAYSKKRKATKRRVFKREFSKWTKIYKLKSRKNKINYIKTRRRYIKQINAIKAKIVQLSKQSNGPDIGIFTYKPYDELIPVEQKLGNKIKYFLWYQSMAEDFNVSLAQWLYSHGKTLELAWEPHDPSKAPGNQPEYSLKSIIHGDQDKAIYRWASQIKTFGHPVYFRPMSEMNGDWVAWGETNGNEPAEYPAAWRHIHTIFAKVHANNVVWVWSPNRDGDAASASQTYSQYYPGHRYVDVVGMSGYNWGTMYNTPTWTSSWQSFSQVFYPSYSVYTTLTNKPIMISETATTDLGGDKATWIKDAFIDINTIYPRIQVLVWFNINKETDWRFDSSSSSTDAFRKYAF